MSRFRHEILGAAAAAFSLPTLCMAAAFVLHSEALATTGRALFVIEGAIALALLPIVIERCRELLARIVLVIMYVLILISNFGNVADGFSEARSAILKPAKTAISDAKHFNEEIAVLTARRGAIAPHAVTGAGSVAASEKAASNAQKARDDECNTGHATKCRAREDDLARVSAALVQAQQSRAATVLSEQIEADLAQANADLAKLGSIPAAADQTAVLVASIAQVVFPAAAADVISDNRAAFMGFIAEFLASLMPWALLKGFGRGRIIPAAKAAAAPATTAMIDAFVAKYIAPALGAPGVMPSDVFVIWKGFCADRKIDHGSLKQFSNDLAKRVTRVVKPGRTRFINIELKACEAPRLRVVEGGKS